MLARVLVGRSFGTMAPRREAATAFRTTVDDVRHYFGDDAVVPSDLSPVAGGSDELLGNLDIGALAAENVEFAGRTDMRLVDARLAESKNPELRVITPAGKPLYSRWTMRTFGNLRNPEEKATALERSGLKFDTAAYTPQQARYKLSLQFNVAEEPEHRALADLVVFLEQLSCVHLARNTAICVRAPALSQQIAGLLKKGVISGAVGEDNQRAIARELFAERTAAIKMLKSKDTDAGGFSRLPIDGSEHLHFKQRVFLRDNSARGVPNFGLPEGAPDWLVALLAKEEKRLRHMPMPYYAHQPDGKYVQTNQLPADEHDIGPHDELLPVAARATFRFQAYPAGFGLSPVLLGAIKH